MVLTTSSARVAHPCIPLQITTTTGLPLCSISFPYIPGLFVILAFDSDFGSDFFSVGISTLVHFVPGTMPLVIYRTLILPLPIPTLLIEITLQHLRPILSHGDLVNVRDM